MADFILNYLDPYIAKSEDKLIYDSQINLRFLPDKFTRMRVSDGYYETTNENEIPASDKFFCDYNMGVILFNPSENGKVVHLDYYAVAEKMVEANIVSVTDEDDKFSINNVQTALAELYELATQLKLIFKNPVDKFEDIATTYPIPQPRWTVQTLDDNKWYVYDGTEWVYASQIQLNQIESKLDKNGDVMLGDLNMNGDKGIIFGNKFKLKLNPDLNSLDIEAL